MNQPYRPTKDLDLLGLGGNAPDHLAEIFGDICRTDVEPDGLIFDAHGAFVFMFQEFTGDRLKQGQWQAFIRKTSVSGFATTLKKRAPHGDV